MKPRWWLFVLRVSLGAVFIVASVTKLSAQSQFVNEVAGYGLLPHALAWVYGMALPWVELSAGCSLVLGVFTTLALVSSILITVSFIIGNIYALYQGVSDSCGCFGQLVPLSHTASLIIDVLMIVTAGVLLLLRNKPTLMSVTTLISKLSLRGHKITEYSMQKMSQFILLIAIVLAIGLPLSLGETTSPVYSEIDSSLEQGKPVLLYFYLEGCGECGKQKPIIDDLEQIYHSSISFIRADYRTEASVAVDFEVTGVPTILLVGGKTDSGYTVLQRFSHFTSKDGLQHGFYEKLGESFCSKYGPIGEFTAIPTSGYVPVKVQFTDSSLGVTERLWEFDWAWDFDNDQIIDSWLQHPLYIYDKPGIYTVSLTSSGPCGSSTVTKWEYLSFVPNEGSASNGCQADFFAESEELNGAIPLRFFDKSRGNIIAWKWDFDSDGTIDSTERNPIYTYTANGEYSVTLTVKTADCENTVKKPNYIKVTGCLG